MPTTSSPCGPYFSCKLRSVKMACRQGGQLVFQKSSRTSLPRRLVFSSQGVRLMSYRAKFSMRLPILTHEGTGVGPSGTLSCDWAAAGGATLPEGGGGADQPGSVFMTGALIVGASTCRVL